MTIRNWPIIPNHLPLVKKRTEFSTLLHYRIFKLPAAAEKKGLKSFQFSIMTSWIFYPFALLLLNENDARDDDDESLNFTSEIKSLLKIMINEWKRLKGWKEIFFSYSWVQLKNFYRLPRKKEFTVLWYCWSIPSVSINKVLIPHKSHLLKCPFYNTIKFT
jgi:hypothetical protein